MKKLSTAVLSVCVIFFIAACATVSDRKTETDHRIHVTILHFNDIYEITPVSGGKEGGIARVATLRKQLLARNPNTITTLGGDLFSPSAVGTAEYQGDRLAGRQMVDVLNHFGLDYATFGNHEFDVTESQFQKRMQEAKFTWVSSNVFNADGLSYDGVQQNLVVHFEHPKSNKTFRIGLFGLTLSTNKAGYVRYTDPLMVAGQQVAQLFGQVDFIIALTHQSIADDVALVQQNPQVDLVLGGHEHINYQRWRGSRFAPILKGDANARSVYVVDLYFDPATGQTEVKPTFVPIDAQLDEDPAVKAVVGQWVTIAFNAFRQQGFEPEKVITQITEPLDGLESSVRSTQTNLTRLIADSMMKAYPDAELSLYNSGAIRIDDTLPPGKITVYDVIRILPFGGQVQLATIKGSLLTKVLNQGLVNKDTGGFLQSANTQRQNGVWLVNGKTIDASKTYRLAINDFLASGRERGLNDLKPGNPDFVIIQSGEGQAYDMRQLLIDALADSE